MYSLDVESLFTNVPVHRTIEIICEKVYNHATISPPPIPKHVLQKLLLTCTTEVPFRDIDGKMYVQIDGVTMGSPLGPTFANFFMSEVETRALDNIDEILEVYCRYIDDIFLLCSEGTLQSLKNEMILISGLNFTYETSINDKLPFLNVMVEKEEGSFRTSVYRKPTDVGACMNACGDAPKQYKTSVIKGFLYRAKSICSDRNDLLLEIKRSKQILVNNGYSNTEVDSEIRRFWKSSERNVTRPSGEVTTHSLFYRNFMSSHYQKDEKVLKDLIAENVTMKEKNRLKLVIYYKNRKTRDLVMKNNLGNKVRELARTNVIYDIRCQKGECDHLPPRNSTYSGFTTCTMSRRLTFHLRDGAVQRHCIAKHKEKVTRKEIETFTKIRYQESDTNRLEILEAIIIHFEDPEINKQDTGTVRKLKLYGAKRLPLPVNSSS